MHKKYMDTSANNLYTCTVCLLSYSRIITWNDQLLMSVNHPRASRYHKIFANIPKNDN